MVTQEHFANRNMTAPSPPLEVQIPTNEQIASIENPGHLPGFLNHGILEGLAKVIKGGRRYEADLEPLSVLVGDPLYVVDPHNHYGLLAAIEPDLRSGKEHLSITSNMSPGLSLNLLFDKDYRLDSGRGVYATHTGVYEGWYSKAGSAPSIGQARTVGHVIKSALPVLLAAAENIEEAAA